MSRSAGDRRARGDSDATGSRGSTPRSASRLPKPFRVVRNHARLFGSMAIGLVTFVACRVTSIPSAPASHPLIGWDTGVLVYLVLAFTVIARFDLALVRRRATVEDEGAIGLLVLTVAAAVASLGAIVAQLGSITGDERRGVYFALAVTTILLSWTFIHVMFALHYAHVYYKEGTKAGGLDFPSDDRPDYWDFVYFAFVIGMTFQVSDVQVTSKLLRRTVVAHGIVSFLFNVAILALVVNIGATLLG